MASGGASSASVSEDDSSSGSEEQGSGSSTNGPRDLETCRCQCDIRLPRAVRDAVYEKYHALSGSEKTLFLRGCVKPKEAKRRSGSGLRAERSVFKYSVEANGVTYEICQNAFLCVLNIKRSKLRTKITNITGRDGPFDETRGRHLNRAHRIDSEAIKSVIQFVEDLPSRESHYSRETQKVRKYLAPDLSISELHRMFLDRFPQHSLSYSTFKNVVKGSCNVRFGSVRSDICETCEKLHVSLAAAKRKSETEAIKFLEQEKESHITQSESFYEKLKSCKASPDPDTWAICMDFEKNLPLPVTNVGPEYYKRQLWLHNFGIIDVVSGEATMFVYSEHFGAKGPNEVISMLDHHIASRKPPESSKLHIFCDNCFSQNKNMFLFVYLDNLCALGIFEEIIVTYPTPGHSYMPIDRAFALIEKKRLKTEKIVCPEDWIRIIKTARPSNPFTVCSLNFNLSSNLLPHQEVENVVKTKDFKTACGDRAKKVAIAKIRSVKFGRSRKPQFQQTVDGPWSEMALLKVGANRYTPLRCTEIDSGFRPVKAAKKKDLEDLLRYVDEEVREAEFFRSVTSSDEQTEHPDEYET